jgi:hypothetical protein
MTLSIVSLLTFKPTRYRLSRSLSTNILDFSHMWQGGLLDFEGLRTYMIEVAASKGICEQ